MIKLLPLLAACMACTPADVRDDNVEGQERHSYATQASAPSPDYAALLKHPAPANLRQRAREATSPLPSNAKQIGDEWIARLKKRGALLGHGLAGKSPDGPVNMIDTGLTEAEFASWTEANGWPVPLHIDWNFVAEMTLPRVSEAAKDAIRIWPGSTTRTGAQNEALFQGRVELRDGCFFVGEFGQKVDKLAWFHAEMALDKDSSGYFILRNRVNGHTLARLGEDMSWGGPASADIDAKARSALLDACGDHEIYIVGSPESSERFMTQYPHLRGPQLAPPPAPKT